MLATAEEVDSIEEAWAASGNAIVCQSAVEPCSNQAAIMVIWAKCCERTRKKYYCMKHYNGYLRRDPKGRGWCGDCGAITEIMYACPIR